jgi:hypothetical protein
MTAPVRRCRRAANRTRVASGKRKIRNVPDLTLHVRMP